MKIKIQQFLCFKLHSWAHCGISLGKEFLKQNHEVDFISTDGVKPQYTPEFIKPYLKEKPVGEYQIQLGYTANKNWPYYFSHGKYNRFAIYAYDGTILPTQWHGFSKYVDLILPPSECAKKVFLDAKIPQEKLVVIPHGVDLEKFNIEPYQLKTTKSIKILNIFGQPHRRKNIDGILETYGQAFNKFDDVCLVLKVIKLQPKSAFEFNISDSITKWKSKYKNHAEIEVIYDYVPNIESLYLACDIHFSLSNIEMFHLISLEAMAAGMVVINSNWGGHTDFMNETNSLLVDGKLGRCPPNYQYWTPSQKAEMFIPNIDDAIAKLKFAVVNCKELKEKFKQPMQDTVQKYSWENAAKQILNLCK
jgi:glycosyltransferase involved in cell wall biosynthesis